MPRFLCTAHFRTQMKKARELLLLMRCSFRLPATHSLDCFCLLVAMVSFAEPVGTIGNLQIKNHGDLPTLEGSEIERFSGPAVPTAHGSDNRCC
jgi:hypothetical protein